MKTVHFIAPVIALAIAVVIVGARRDSRSKLESESAILRQRIEAVKIRPEPAQAPPRPGKTNSPGKEKVEIDWMEMAESTGELLRSAGSNDMRKFMALQTKLRAMDKEELIAALDQLEALDLDDNQRMMLDDMVIGLLGEKDPELALTRYASRLGQDRIGLSRQLAKALVDWAKKDRSAAIAWLDKEIAAGTFDVKTLEGNSRTRLTLEGKLIASLLGTDQQAAASRIATLPADQRKDVFEYFASPQMKPEDFTALAELARSQLPVKDSIEVLGKQASSIGWTGDFAKVEAFMDQISATPEERIRSSEDAARSSITGKAYQSKITAAQIDSMREWLGTQAPASVDRVTGEALGKALNYGGKMKMKFSEASELVLQYHAESGSDDLLTGFLSNARDWQNQEDGRSIAEKISDPEKRNEALELIK